MRGLLVSLMAMFLSLSLYAQSGHLSFEYDANGNRISRAIVLESSRSALSKKQNEPLSYKDQIDETAFRVYPNPVKSQLNISIERYKDDMEGMVQLYTYDGILIEDHGISSETTSIDMLNYTPGLYILRIKLNGKNSSWKIIKQ